MPNSVLEAIKLGLWDYEPEKVPDAEFDSTRALPGTNAKLAVLTERLRLGLPLWHSSDVRSFDDLEEGSSE